jgi:hypothetical protein
MQMEGFFGLVCVFWAVGLALEVFWLWMLIDCLVYEPTPTTKSSGSW